MKSCFECNKPAEYKHHVVPKVRGGTKTVPLCAECHSKAHHKNKKMTTGETTKEALHTLIKAGKKTGGHIPFGYDVDKEGTLIPNNREIKHLHLIFDMRSKGASLRTIGKELKRLKIKTKTNKEYWHPAVISNILKRRLEQLNTK